MLTQLVNQFWFKTKVSPANQLKKKAYSKPFTLNVHGLNIIGDAIIPGEKKKPLII